jgi:CPA2 family monovalent cation:H+ antiporter-2/glutathione-regulated potassium-efflux system protein KefB
MNQSFFLQALVYLGAGVLIVPLIKRLGMGSVMGYLLAGIVIGPYLLGFVGGEGQDIMHVAEFGVVMMLFLVGLELEPSRLWRMRSSILGLGGLQVLATAIVFTVPGILLGLSWKVSLAAGLILSMSSTAIVLQTMTEKGLLQSSAGQNSFSVLLFQDLAVIPILALLPLLSSHGTSGSSTGHEHSGWMDTLPGWAQTLAVLGAVALVIVAGRTLVRPLLRYVASTRLRELFTATALLLVVGVTALMSAVGLSPALGTFLGGMVLANSEFRHELESDIEPFKGLLLGLFFIAVGASINFGLFAQSPGLIVGLVFIVMVLKTVILFVLARIFKIGTDQGLVLAVSLSQVGEFAFVLLSFSGQLGIFNEETNGIMMAVVALTMAVSPLVILANEKLILPRVGTKEIPESREADAINEKNPVIIAGFGRFGNIVGRFLKANGIGTTVLEIDSDRVELLRKLGLKVYYGDATRDELLKSAGANEAQLIVIALDSPEKCLELVETVKKHFPHLHVLVRAYDRSDAYELMDAGVLHIYRETLDTSLRVGVDALKLLGRRSFQAHRAMNLFRKHDNKALKQLAAVRDDHKQYINQAREMIEELEKFIEADILDKSLDYDAAWDVDSLRDEIRSMGKMA